MKGKLIVIDGADGCGKSTQTEILIEKLKKEHKNVLFLSYPDYSKPSSTLVQMYLNGDISQDMNEVNAYAASSFYAVDRYVSYLSHWKELYNQGYVIVSSRYVSANAIHQMCKLQQNEWDKFLEWLNDYEYNKLGLPKPDKIIYLNMDRTVADRLIMSRYGGDESKKDIHEQNTDYLKKCIETALYAAEKESWDIIECSDKTNPFSIDEISEKIYKKVTEIF